MKIFKKRPSIDKYLDTTMTRTMDISDCSKPFLWVVSLLFVISQALATQEPKFGAPEAATIRDLIYTYSTPAYVFLVQFKGYKISLRISEFKSCNTVTIVN